MNNDALLEIGVEHLPARFVPDALAQMETLAKAQLAENNIVYASLRAFGSFRKLALVIDGVEPKSKDIEKEIKGPPAKMLKDAAGNFTPQSAGFADKNGVKPAQLIVKDTPNGPFIFAEIKIKGVSAQKLLPQIFINIITGLQFPKNMTWEPSGLRFARPIRTLIGLYGGKILKFEIAGVKSSRFTRPISSFGVKGIKIPSPDKYVSALKNLPQPILIEPAERETALVKAINKETGLRGLTAVIDGDLLKETVFMTEHPVAVPGDFEIRFLTLPKELIVTVLKKQLKMFHAVNKNGEIEPYFIAVRDGVSVNQPEVRDGFKKVMSARLSDAVFFFEADLKKGLNFFREKLQTVRFIDGFGTMLDKTERVQKIAQWLAGKCGADGLTVGQTARFAYADLTSSVVYEFPELQGYMGGVYAGKENMSEAVCKGLREFYFPLTASSDLPSSLESALVSIAGKIDSIAGNFAAGQIPTGSEDPFALRRQAMGIVRMLEYFKLSFTPEELVAYTAGLYGDKGVKIIQHVREFLHGRIVNLLENEGFDTGVINSVAGQNFSVTKIFTVAKALQKMRGNEDLSAVAESAKRVVNILRQSNSMPGEVDKNLFTHPAENSLFDKLTAIGEEFGSYSVGGLTENDCEKIFSRMAGLKSELSGFFENVMVNVEDRAIKNNRLSLLEAAKLKLLSFADITKLN
ncbi:glycine--tRNA ligase beta subunit [Bacteroidia bacterium]|nr:glycine--tRNA ligase beta subunit [Bacteroidia bacterium]